MDIIWKVTNSYKDLVPDYYTRKQTLANAERYITPELKELEDMILGAEDKLYALEYELYSEVRETIAAQVERIQKTAKAVAGLDVFTSLALVAERNHYVRPKINEKGIIDIKEGRHPVVEKMIPNDMFISNDTYLDDKKNRISIITGPNIGRKIHLYASDSSDRSDGTGGLFCSGTECEYRTFGSDLYPCRGIG